MPPPPPRHGAPPRLITHTVFFETHPPPPHGTLSSPSFHKLNVYYAPSLGEEYKIGVLEPQQQFSNLVCARVWLGARV